MWNCLHPECHNPTNCAICSNEDVAWCSHQECRHQGQQLPTGAKPQPRRASVDEWTPSRVGNVLKLVFVAAAAGGTWWLLQHSASRFSGRDPLAPDANTSTVFSSWEPET